MKIMEVKDKNKVQIKCLTCDSIDNYHYYVTIYNSKNNIVYKGYASSRGIVKFEVPYIDIYKIIVRPDENIYPSVICRKFELIPCISLCLYFIFYKLCRNVPHRVTFNLTDNNYKDLPIMKGEIFLWPHHM